MSTKSGMSGRGSRDGGQFDVAGRKEMNGRSSVSSGRNGINGRTSAASGNGVHGNGRSSVASERGEKEYGDRRSYKSGTGSHHSQSAHGSSAGSATSSRSNRSHKSNFSDNNTSRRGYIFMSYQWRHRALMEGVKDWLEEAGIQVSIDIDPQTGTIHPPDQTSLVGAALVIIGLSSKYRENIDCEVEAKFAQRMNKRILFLQLEEGYTGSDWLKPMVKDNVLIDFTQENDMVNKMNKLIEVIRREMKRCNIRIRRVMEFKVNTPLDRRPSDVTGILGLPNNKIVVVDKDNKLLKLFSEDGQCQCIMSNPQETWGITSVSGSEFATCGLYDQKVHFWKVEGDTIVKTDKVFSLPSHADAIDFNGKYFVVLHRQELKLSLLSPNGRELGQINMAKIDGGRIDLGRDVKLDKHEDLIYLPVFREVKGVLCIEFEFSNRTLEINLAQRWRCPLLGRPSAIMKIDNIICATDLTTKSVEMIAMDETNRGTLLWHDFLEGQPNCISCYTDGSGVRKLLLSYSFFDGKRSHITVFRFL